MSHILMKKEQTLSEIRGVEMQIRLTFALLLLIASPDSLRRDERVSSPSTVRKNHV